MKPKPDSHVSSKPPIHAAMRLASPRIGIRVHRVSCPYCKGRDKAMKDSAPLCTQVTVLSLTDKVFMLQFKTFGMVR